MKFFLGMNYKFSLYIFQLFPWSPPILGKFDLKHQFTFSSYRNPRKCDDLFLDRIFIDFPHFSRVKRTLDISIIDTSSLSPPTTADCCIRATSDVTVMFYVAMTPRKCPKNALMWHHLCHNDAMWWHKNVIYDVIKCGTGPCLVLRWGQRQGSMNTWRNTQQKGAALRVALRATTSIGPSNLWEFKSLGNAKEVNSSAGRAEWICHSGRGFDPHFVAVV